MLMIGVMPLPALMNSSFSGSGSGSTNVALDAAEADDRARACASRTRYGETLPSSTSLGVIEMKPSGRPGSEVSEYARQWCMPSTTTPMRRYWPGSWPSHSQPGRITTVDRVVGLAARSARCGRAARASTTAG